MGNVKSFIIQCNESFENEKLTYEYTEEKINDNNIKTENELIEEKKTKENENVILNNLFQFFLKFFPSEKPKNINENYIIATYYTDNNYIQIINCYEQIKKKLPLKIGENNLQEIKNNCELLINNIKIDFSLKYIFENKGRNTVKFNFSSVYS